MRILGVDPGLSTAGLGLIEASPGGKTEAIDWLTIKTDPASPLSDRLVELQKDLEEFLDESKPELAVVEQVFFATNKRSAMDVSQARGVIVVTLKKRGIEVMDVTPLQLKTAVTGDGAADKKQMQAMVQRILNLDEPPTPADAADALAMALYGAYNAKNVQRLAMRPS